MEEIVVDLMWIQSGAQNAYALKWVVETIMQQIVLIVPRVMEQLGAMGIAIGLMTNVCLYDICVPAWYMCACMISQ